MVPRQQSIVRLVLFSYLLLVLFQQLVVIVFHKRKQLSIVAKKKYKMLRFTVYIYSKTKITYQNITCYNIYTQ